MHRQILPNSYGRLLLLLSLSTFFVLALAAVFGSLGMLAPDYNQFGAGSESAYRGVQRHLEQETPTQGLATSTVWIHTNDQRVPIEVELAQTPVERQIGLMFRDELAKGTGMLFSVDAGDRPTIWMKNTRIPLDVAFIGQSGEILVARQHLVPMSEDVIDCQCPAAAILELPAGTLEELSIGVGTKTMWQSTPEL